MGWTDIIDIKAVIDAILAGEAVMPKWPTILFYGLIALLFGGIWLHRFMERRQQSARSADEAARAEGRHLDAPAVCATCSRNVTVRDLVPATIHGDARRVCSRCADIFLSMRKRDGKQSPP